MQNMQDTIRTLENLEGVNKDCLEASLTKHYQSLLLMQEDLIEVINIYDEYGIPYVKESGIIDFISLTRTKEEALEYAKNNSNVMSIEEYSSSRKAA